MKFEKLLAFLFVLSFCFSSQSHALIVVSDDSIDPNNDLVIVNEPIDQKLSDAVVLRIHKLQSVNKDKPIYLLLDSPGGEVVEGARIIDAMVASKRPIYTVAVGETASMAAIIHSYGEKRYILPNAILMFHTISGGYSGDIVRVQSRLKMAKMLQDRYVRHIVAHSNTTEEELNRKMMDEWWINSDEAIERKFADDTIMSTAFIMTKEEEEKKPPATPESPWLPWLPLIPKH